LIGTVAQLGDEENALIVAHATRPGPRAIHTPAYFDRDKAYCEDLVRQYHSATAGVLNYVGEWHSHPSVDTRPSPLDNASLYEVVRDSGYKIASPVSIIQSTVDGTRARATIYSMDRGQYDENVILSPFAELKRLFPKLIQDLDPYPIQSSETEDQERYPYKESASWQRKKRSLLSTLKQLWT